MSWHPAGVDSWSIAADVEKTRDVDLSSTLARIFFPAVLLAELGVILLIAYVDGVFTARRRRNRKSVVGAFLEGHANRMEKGVSQQSGRALLCNDSDRLSLSLHRNTQKNNPARAGAEIAQPPAAGPVLPKKRKWRYDHDTIRILGSICMYFDHAGFSGDRTNSIFLHTVGASFMFVAGVHLYETSKTYLATMLRLCLMFVIGRFFWAINVGVVGSSSLLKKD